jgi:poly(A) polymerase
MNSSPENITILHRDHHPISRKQISSATLKVLYRLQEEGFTAYLAGGAVRDLMLHRQPKDFDVATEATPEQIRRLFRNCRIIGRRFRLAHVIFKNETIETSTFRAPIPTTPKDAQQGKTMTVNDGLVIRDNLFGTPEEDALRRDFTINALFYNLSDFTVIDHAGGLEDLKQRLIRVIGDPDRRFTEDPVRMIRAARFAGTLDFQIHQADFDSIRRNAPLLEQASSSRMYEEVQKLFFCGHAKKVYHWLEKTDLIRPMFTTFSNWVDEDPKRHDWVIQALEQMDRWREAQLSIHPALLFALIFGEYHETLIAQKIEKGNAPFDAARDTVYQHLNSICLQVRIPKTVIYQVCDIMTNQLRFPKTKGRQPQRFMQSAGFLDAFLYLKYTTKTHNRDQDLLEFWAQLRRENPIKRAPHRAQSRRRRPHNRRK